jgi:hypothetical protein
MKSPSAVILALFCSLLAVSCIVDTEATPEESTGEAQQQLPPLGGFKASEFKFSTTVHYSGGGAGGWQEAKANLDFWRITIPRRVKHWKCPVTVGMPLRSEEMGRISSSRAARMSARVATAAMRSMDFKLPQGIFCKEFVAVMVAKFRKMYPKSGARVTG